MQLFFFLFVCLNLVLITAKLLCNDGVVMEAIVVVVTRVTMVAVVKGLPQTSHSLTTPSLLLTHSLTHNPS